MIEFNLFYEKERTVEEILYSWLESIRICVKIQSYQKYKFLIDEHICPIIGMLSEKAITSQIIDEFIYNKHKSGQKRGNGSLSAGYVNTICYILNASLGELLNKQIKRPPVKKKQVTYLSLSEQKMLEKYIFENEPERGIGIVLSLYTGMRIGEVCALKWCDIDFLAKTVKINKTLSRIKNNYGEKKKTKVIVDSAKTENADRIIPLPKKIIDLLKKIPQGEYVLRGRNKPYCDVRTYQYFFKKILSKCGMRDVNYHSLRHTFATRCIEAGVDVKTLSEILGHSNVNVTLNTYVHSTLKQKKMQMEKLMKFCE